MAMAYAGDLTPPDAWRVLADEPAATLVDVRTEAEWTFVGVPDLAPLGKKVLFQPWQAYPGMQHVENFATLFADFDRATPLLFLCRSGARSAHAARALAELGFHRCYNVAGGFEGERDGHGHRGTVNGWKVCGLPWQQG